MKLNGSIAGGALLGALLFLSGCGDSPGPTGPDNLNLDNAIALEGGSALVFQDNGQLNAHRARVEQTVRETLAAVRRLIPMDGITLLVSAGTNLVIPELGIGGRADGGTIRMVLNPNSPQLASSLESAELFSLLAHEMHHVARSRTVGYGSNLLGAMVSEGLADQFSMEVAGVDPPLWSLALSGDALAEWSARAREEWSNENYNHDGVPAAAGDPEALALSLPSGPGLDPRWSPDGNRNLLRAREDTRD